MISETKNYEMFSRHSHNREVIESVVLQVMRSIQIKNLLHHKPILVDANMQVIDGQHRLEAAKRLGIPIFYKIDNDTKCDDILLLNNSKSWSRDDYLTYYCAAGNLEYIKIKSFMEKHNVTLSTALSVLGVQNDKREDGRKTSVFKTGKFIFPSAKEEMNSVKILENSNIIIDYIHPKIESDHRYIFGPAFRRALYIFLSIKAVDFDIFMDKLAHRIDLIRPCARIIDSVNVFKQVYNWKNRNPVTLDEYTAA